MCNVWLIDLLWVYDDVIGRTDTNRWNWSRVILFLWWWFVDDDEGLWSERYLFWFQNHSNQGNNKQESPFVDAVITSYLLWWRRWSFHRSEKKPKKRVDTFQLLSILYRHTNQLGISCHLFSLTVAELAIYINNNKKRIYRNQTNKLERLFILIDIISIDQSLAILILFVDKHLFNHWLVLKRFNHYTTFKGLLLNDINLFPPLNARSCVWLHVRGNGVHLTSEKSCRGAPIITLLP